MKSKKGNKKNKLVFKLITPSNLISATSIKDIDTAISVEVIDFKSGKKIGKFSLEEIKLKFL